ncbi:MAG: hypothetical protein LKG48_01160 [Lachnospiraceae bacterium]|jgi:hypothetical protein|nr:hypothetical protein [Lachnospiraceae bacterium]MCH4063093.1 hypothetical protein [Lachnospiraceae bacterium]MCH4104401.1 hypothetical protein [Lachnospiraceae bacterium]MCI1308374.1 hypothetical protein [Lachnospiraceae bacterium]MCI1333228.1 hypothetical protein [Lachnospiraceae bacterium]
MKNPLHYQLTEYDCGPTSMLDAVSFLFEREEIPAEIIRETMLYCMDCHGSDGLCGTKGTSCTAMMFLANWYSNFGVNGQMPIATRYERGPQVYIDTEDDRAASDRASANTFGNQAESDRVPVNTSVNQTAAGRASANASGASAEAAACPVSAEASAQGREIPAGASLIRRALSEGSAVVVRLFLDEAHYVLLTGIDGDDVYMFDPYYQDGPLDFAPDIRFVDDHPFSYNRIVPAKYLNAEGETIYSLGPKATREAIIITNTGKMSGALVPAAGGRITAK